MSEIRFEVLNIDLFEKYENAYLLLQKVKLWNSGSDLNYDSEEIDDSSVMDLDKCRFGDFVVVDYDDCGVSDWNYGEIGDSVLHVQI